MGRTADEALHYATVWDALSQWRFQAEQREPSRGALRFIRSFRNPVQQGVRWQ